MQEEQPKKWSNDQWTVLALGVAILFVLYAGIQVLNYAMMYNELVDKYNECQEKIMPIGIGRVGPIREAQDIYTVDNQLPPDFSDVYTC